MGVSGTTDRSRTICPLPSHSFFPVLPRRVGFDERRSWVLGRTLGKLDKLSRDDQQAAPRSGTHHLRKPLTRECSVPHILQEDRWSAQEVHGTSHMGGLSHKRTNLWSRASRDMVGRRRLTCVSRRNILRRGCGPLSTTLTDRAMSRSQRGPLAAAPFVSVPSN